MINLYTDGAFSPKHKTGAWAVVQDNGQCVRSGLLQPEERPTNNIAELKGVIAALKISENARTTIHCDSQYVVRSYNEWMIKWERNGWKLGSKPNSKPVKNVGLMKMMFNLRISLPNVTVKWIRGHNGNHLNEEADRIAKKIVSDYISKK